MATDTEPKRMCAGVDCPNEAGTLQCPSCLKLALKDSYFCSQDCFKRSWVCIIFFPSVETQTDNPSQAQHRSLHKSSNPLRNLFTPDVVSKPDPITGTFNPFPTFSFPGQLRPVYPLSETRKVPASIPRPDYAKDGIPRSERAPGRQKIQILNKEEQAGMRKVCRMAREVLDIAAAAAVPGVTTDYIDEIVHNACVERKVCRQHCLAKLPENPAH